MTGICFTVDLEDHTGIYAPNGRYVGMTHRVLDLCDEYKRHATFFTIGRVAKSAPDLIKEISARGHEIAYHSHSHVPLTEDTPENFRQQGEIDKDKLEQLSGKSVVGFRAPRFSLVPSTLWATGILSELGFKYSSSIMPTNISLFGFPNASRHSFKWKSGLIELPLPVAKIGFLRLPYLGGIYLYALPFFITRSFLHRADDGELLWTYSHPYDFDKDEPLNFISDTPRWVSVVLWLARKRAENKIRELLIMEDAGTMGEFVSKTIDSNKHNMFEIFN